MTRVSSTMVNAILFLWLKGWHAPAGRRTCEPRPLAQDGQIRPARRWVPENLGPADESLAGQPRKGRQPIRRSGRTQAPDPTSAPPQNRASRAGSSTHILPAESERLWILQFT